MNIILGIDGGCFESINPLLKKKLLPNFQKLIDNGFSSKLIVSVPPVTIPSWPCLFSGLSPQQLGYYWFDHPKKGLFNSYEWQKDSIFSLKSFKAFVLNVPGTYPAWKINGEMITGMMSPSFSCFPKELKFFLEKNWIIDGKTIHGIFEAFNIKKRLFLRKIKEDFDLMVYVIRVPDSLSHHTHLSREHITNYINLGYQKIDVFLGEILNNENIDNILIFSDHGLKYYNYEFNLRRWLEKKGLLFINNSKNRKLYSIVAKIYDLFRPIIKIDYNKYNKLKGTLLRNIINDSISTQKNVDHTKILNFFGNTGGLYLQQKDKVKKDIIRNELKKDRRIKEVTTPEMEDFPDLMIELKDKYIFNHESSLFVIRGRNTINHSQNGFFIAYGNDIKKGRKNTIDYKDIAPTILKLYGVSKLNSMNGNPLDIIKN